MALIDDSTYWKNEIKKDFSIGDWEKDPDADCYAVLDRICEFDRYKDMTWVNSINPCIENRINVLEKNGKKYIYQTLNILEKLFNGPSADNYWKDILNKRGPEYRDDLIDSLLSLLNDLVDDYGRSVESRFSAQNQADFISKKITGLLVDLITTPGKEVKNNNDLSTYTSYPSYVGEDMISQYEEDEFRQALDIYRARLNKIKNRPGPLSKVSKYINPKRHTLSSFLTRCFVEIIDNLDKKHHFPKRNFGRNEFVAEMLRQLFPDDKTDFSPEYVADKLRKKQSSNR